MPQVSAPQSARDDDAPDRHGQDAHGRAALAGHDAHESATPAGRDAGTHPPSASHVGTETLDRYAAAGGMAPDRIRRILADLVPSLEALHRAGRAHGDIAPSTIGLDASGQARLLTPPLAPAANAEDAPRRDGYAAFEQYTDDPDTPCGPWTDIYALSATACALLTGLAPPAALARCVRDDYVPLTQRRGQDEQAFCVVLDNGLALDAYARPQTIDEFARVLRLDITPPASRPPVAEAPPARRQSMLEDADGLEATSAWISARATHGGNQLPAMAAGAAAGIAGGGATAAGAAAVGAAAGASTAASAYPPPDYPSGPSQDDPASAKPGYASRDAGRTTPAPASEVALYREGQLAEAQPGKGGPPRQEPARDQAAVDYEAAVAAMHTRKDPEPSQAQRAQVPPAGKAQHRRRHQRKQRAPLLTILAVIVMVGAALYVWLRPQPTPRGNVVASASSTASGSGRIPASNSALATGPGSTAANAQNAPNASNGGTSGTRNNATGSGASGSAAGGTSSNPQNSASAATNATSSQAPENSMSSGAMAMNPGMSGTAGATPPNATSSTSSTLSTPSASGASPSPSTSSSTSIAAPGTATPATGEQGIAAQKLPNQTITTVDLGKPTGSTSSAGKSSAGTGANTGTGAGTGAGSTVAAGSTATPADATAKPRAASKASVAVAIAVRPWGEILVNGKSRGVSPPLNSLTLAPGTYDITIRNNAGPDVRQSLTVAAGKSATISHTFR